MKNDGILCVLLQSIFISVAVLGALTSGHADTLSHRLTATVNAEQKNAETYQLDFSDSDAPGYDTDLQVFCIKGCLSPVKYSEQDDNSSGSLTAFRLSKDSPDLVTIWGGGDGYYIKIYRVGNGKITRVLDQGTRSWPQITIDNHNDLLVLLAPGIEANYPDPIHFQLWAWNGERYQVRRTMGSAEFDIEYTRCEARMSRQGSTP